MARLLSLLFVLLAQASSAQAPGDRHSLTIELYLDHASGTSDFGPWTDGASGKLRFDATGSELSATRLLFDYRARLAPTWFATLDLDYVPDASSGIDFTEAFLQWRPIPSGSLRQRMRFGALYPPFSLENGDQGWASPFTTSFSAINSWLGEEIRPLAVEWTADRRMGFPGSPHELGAFAATFFANDPAGTLLFWRGFAVHDRQSRIADRLPMPPAPVFENGAVTGYREQSLEPFAEIDHRPGFYAGIKWQYAERALLQLASWDNRADPASYSDGQWSWRTKFRQLSSQLDLPAGFGLITQWMRGDTHWFIRTGPNGTLTPLSELVDDDFEAWFVLLTKRFGNAQRITLRHDRFQMDRGTELGIDSGDAWTIAYRFEPTRRMTLSLEWLRIDSDRQLRERLYASPANSSERMRRLQWRLRFGPAMQH